ncbi:MAG: hypothetical protein ACJ77K_06800 [Bacteroidia bacterium]
MKKIFICVVVVSTLFWGCRDLIEKNLSKEHVFIVAPANNTVSAFYSQQFIWEEVEGADHYQLQIVKPDFASIQQYVLDTSIVTTKFSYTLLPGTYQWRVKALNGSSETEFSMNNLVIDSALDLSGQPTVLISPADNYSSNSFTQSFSWQPMPNATNYLFQVLESGTVIRTESTTAHSTTYTFSVEGNYQWRVFAQNATSGSACTLRTISIDNTAPGVPVLTAPLANDTASNPVALSWTSDVSSVADSVYIYADTNLTVLTIAELVTTQSYSFTGAVGADYFWRVRSKDAAGNWGPFSLRRKFIVGP